MGTIFSFPHSLEIEHIIEFVQIKYAALCSFTADNDPRGSYLAQSRCKMKWWPLTCELEINMPMRRPLCSTQLQAGRLELKDWRSECEAGNPTKILTPLFTPDVPKSQPYPWIHADYAASTSPSLGVLGRSLFPLSASVDMTLEGGSQCRGR